MSKILAVFGATGQQGSSVINNVLKDPELSQQYSIRAITRDTSSEKAQALQKHVQIVQGDGNGRSSLEVALTGVHTVFAMTTPTMGPDAIEVEFNTAKNIVDVAIAKGVEHIIWSTLPAISEISKGKYTKVTPFDAKAKVEEYIRSLPIKSSFVSLGFFMENFQSQPFLAPQKASDGTWVLSRAHSAKTLYPLIAAVEDVGKFVGAILAEPEKYEGKRFCAATALYSIEEIADQLSKSAGERVIFKQVSEEEFRQSIPIMVDVFAEAYAFCGEFGYFGPGTEETVAWAAANARGELSTLEDFLKAHPFKLA